MALRLQYGQVEAILAFLNNIAEDKRVAFQGRLKHLQRLGFPEGINTGKGKAATYTFGHLMQMVLALEFLQSGLTPQLAVDFVNRSWVVLVGSIHLAAKKPSEEDNEWLWIIHPEALRPLSTSENTPDTLHPIHFVMLKDLSTHLEFSPGFGLFRSRWRSLVINGTRLTRSVIMTVAFHFRYAEIKEIQADILEGYHDRYMKYAYEVDEMADDVDDLVGASATDKLGRVRIFNGLAAGEAVLKKAGETLPTLDDSLLKLLLRASRGVENGEVKLTESDIEDLIAHGIYEVMEPDEEDESPWLHQTEFGTAMLSLLNSWGTLASEDVDGDDKKA